MSFFQYTQNNSGGSFELNEENGITAWVVIEADSPDAADLKAEQIGIYFDGCDSDIDCACCGDRWSRAYGDGDAAPMVYGKDPDDAGLWRWVEGPQVCIHYMDGRKEWKC